MIEFCDSWKKRKTELFVNVTADDPAYVCVEHEVFVPCRACLYQEAATQPYSAEKKDLDKIRKLNQKAANPSQKQSEKKRKR